eukprot:CAMPEP_0195511158 /NCGR_PEP_ID=MMETSP0794_2-20130614/3585_1 /TAXON_ID=515487 /ORGANISM="Stephanopyxis turris, Strain CCMP 815" /LENGTH=231 /DNA_ID=CAMNT_0040638707 /DNA_START=202 /DNA_END=894 /DNA_ORIENTATION=-
MDELLVRNLRRMAAELNNLGGTFHDGNRAKEGLQLYKNALEAISFSLQEAKNCQNLHNFQDQIIEFQAGVAKKQQKVYQQPYTRTLLMQNHEPTSFSEAIQIQTDETDKKNSYMTAVVILYNSGLLNSQLGSVVKAVRFFNMGLSMLEHVDCDIKCKTAVTVAIRYNLGKIHYEHGDKSKAMEFLVDALRLGKQNLRNHTLVASVLNLIGHLLLGRGLITDAMMVFEEAIW